MSHNANLEFLSGGTKNEALRGKQQEKQPLNTPQGSRAAQWGWGKHQTTTTTQTTNPQPKLYKKGAPPSYGMRTRTQEDFVTIKRGTTKTHTKQYHTKTHANWSKREL